MTVKEFLYSKGGLWIIPGYHIVNRLGYIVCNKPYEDNCEEEYLY